MKKIENAEQFGKRLWDDAISAEEYAAEIRARDAAIIAKGEGASLN